MSQGCSSLVSSPSFHDCRTNFIFYGTFTRKHDGAKVKRYRCLSCKKTFSDSSARDTCWQKKPFINKMLVDLLCAGVSQRRAAFILKVNRKTIVRKFILMGRRAKQILPQLNSFFSKIIHLEFDDLETFEHTKCKPLSVTLGPAQK